MNDGTSVTRENWSQRRAEMRAMSLERNLSNKYVPVEEKGLVTPDKLPEVGDALHEGNIGYHLRKGDHFLSREDWNQYFRFLEKHR